MLASSPVRAAGERSTGLIVAAAAAALPACALFFSGGDALPQLVWIGAIALLVSAAFAGALPLPRIDGAAAAFLGCLGGLALWMGVSTVWSISPDRSWMYTNRTLVYTAFALAGALTAARLSRGALAGGAAALLGLVFGWALLAKCIPALYPSYGAQPGLLAEVGLARLRSPVGYWNELALLGAAAVPLALWHASRRRASGTLLLFLAALTTLLTYSRFGVALAVATAVVWLVLDRDRVEGLAAALLGGGAAAGAFGVALALPGITKDGQPHGVRVHDGWIFALVVLALGAAVVLVALVRPPVPAERRRAIERIAAVAAIVAAVAGLAVAGAFAGRIWHSFSNPVSSQINSTSNRLGSLSSSNRWRWWQEEWHAFTGHPAGGTGAGTFQLTDLALRQSSLVTSTEPHNVPLQLLGETGIVGLLLYLGAAAAAVAGIVRARGGPAVTALGLSLAAFLVHNVVDMDWNYVATCGPFLFVAGALLARAPEPAARPRRLLAAGAVLVALAACYSLAAPWLAQRELAKGTEAAAKQAHSYDPLSTDALTTWAAFEDVAGNRTRAEQLYRQAVGLEPQSTDTWYALGSFYYDHGDWGLAYTALADAWKYDRYGPAGVPCGLLDQARHKALGVWPASCPGGRRASTP
jgi:hypothetical protein